MAIVTGDLAHYGSASGSNQGGAISGSLIASNVDNNLLPDVTDVERAAGITVYRKAFWKNVNATDAAAKPIVFAKVLPASATLSLGIGPNHADDTDAAQGNMTAFGAAARVALASDGADTRVATIYGLDNGGVPAPVVEAVTLTGAAEVLSVGTFSKVHAVHIASIDASRTVTVAQGTGGTVRGTIGPSKIACWLWYPSPGATKAAGIALPDLAAGQAYGVWHRYVVAAGAPSVKPNTYTVRIEENA